MKWWQVVSRHIGKGILTGMAVDSWRRSVIADIERKRRENESPQGPGFAETSDRILNQDENLKLTGKVIEARDSYSEVEIIKSKVEALKNKISNNTLGPGETQQMIQSDLLRYKEEQLRATAKYDLHNKDLFEYIDKIRQKDIFDGFWDFLENYKVFLDTLSLDQKVALINLIGYITLLSSSISIVLILGANYIINRLNLESKFPWLNRFIRVREKVSSITLKLYILSFFLVIFIYLGLNIYMLIWRG